MVNEKKTDIIVAQMLSEVGINFTPNGSNVEEVNNALASSSKRGTGRKGFPEFVAMSNGFVIVIEDKANVFQQARYMDDQAETLLMDIPSICDYAENGAVHYAQNIIAKTTFKKV
ncbi:MAG: SAM-dependent DNA methyltransferase, partial [Prevotella sp.]|nr:SAM-dependent DNA methyltransferase [Prevotella sp.]